MVEVRVITEDSMKCQSCGKVHSSINQIKTQRDDFTVISNSLYLCNKCLEKLIILGTMNLREQKELD